MADPENPEEHFSRDRQKLQTKFSECVSTAEKLLGLRLQARSAHLETLAGPLRPDTVAGQQIIMSWTYRVGEVDRKIEISIGHHGEEWDPVVILADHNGEVQSAVLKRPDWMEYGPFQSAIINALKRINA